MANQPIPNAYIEEIRKLVFESLSDDDALMHWLAQYMTRPKYPHLTDITGEVRTAYINDSKLNSTIRYKNGQSD